MHLTSLFSQNILIIELFTIQVDPLIIENICILLIDWIKEDPFRKQSRQLALLQAYHEYDQTFHLNFLDLLYRPPLTLREMNELYNSLTQVQNIDVAQRTLWMIALFSMITTQDCERLDDLTTTKKDHLVSIKYYLSLITSHEWISQSNMMDPIHKMTQEIFNLKSGKVQQTIDLNTLPQRMNYLSSIRKF